jgi:hypothetical protein
MTRVFWKDNGSWVPKKSLQRDKSTDRATKCPRELHWKKCCEIGISLLISV